MKKTTSPITSDELVFLYDNFGAPDGVSEAVQEKADEILGRLSQFLFAKPLQEVVDRVHDYSRKQPNAVID